jgi:phosphoglycolate phosphatase-like HAD superfamily hydrolase
MPRLLALDFDGVISDSAPEAFVVALRTWCGMRLDSSLCARSSLLRGPAAPPAAAIAGDPLYAGFLEAMPLGNRAEDYAVELQALESKTPFVDQAGYDAFKAGIDPAWLRAFHKRFYRERASMSDADPQAWRCLMAPFPGIPELLRRRAADAVLAIATSKDRRSVAKLLDAYGLADLFPEGRVLDKETGATKRAHLEQLQRDLGIAYEEMTFVDDKVNHLDAVFDLGVRCGLAAWGYNGEREVALAGERGYLVLFLEDSESQLFGEDGGGKV